MRLANLGVAMVFAVALLVGVGASAQVVQGIFNIEDSGIGTDAVVPYDATVFVASPDSAAGVAVVCGGPLPADQVVLRFFTDVPDSVKLTSTKAKIEQKQKGNLPDFDAAGDGTLVFALTPVTCEKSQLKGEVNTKKNQGKAKVSAKNCTGLAAAELDYIDAVCGTENKALKIKRDGSAVKSIQVNLKGTAAPS